MQSLSGVMTAKARRGRGSFRLALLGAASLLSAACRAQSVPDPLELVRHASYNELHGSGAAHPFRYRIHKVDDGKSIVRDVIETRDGDVVRLLETDGKPLDPAANKKELDRLQALRNDPGVQAARHKHDAENSKRDNEMVTLLPGAFLYTYVGMAAGPNGPCYRLHFEPNPQYTPPDRQAEVFHGMAGELWIDQAQQRMARFEAHLIEDVDFGWGIFGRLDKGGTILVQNRDVGSHHWETAHMRLNLTGKIAMVKSLRIDTTEDSFDFQPVPDEGYQAAVGLLEQTHVN